MKTALVIGPRSMLGAQLCKALEVRGIKVLTAGRSPDDSFFFDLKSASSSTSSDESEADVAFHCAASFESDSDEGLAKNFEINTVSAWKVSAFCKSLKVGQLIYAGTVSSSYSATDKGNFNSYGLSKSLGEQILDWVLTKERIGFCSLRFSQLVDTEGLCCRHQLWFGRIIAYTSRGLDLRLPKSLGNRNYLHVTDAAEFMIRAAEIELAGVHEIVHPEFYDCDQLTELAYSIFKLGGRIIRAPEKQPFRKFGFPNAGAVFELLGQPKFGMKTVIEMIRDQDTSLKFGPMDVQ